MAHCTGYLSSQLGTDHASDTQQLALCVRAVRVSIRVVLGAKGGSAEKASLGELVVLVDVQEGYRLWSASYDHDANPIVALERRVIRGRLGILPGRRLLDVATGTGYWLTYALSQGARAFGLDLSPEMLRQAANKPGLANRLVRADMNVLPLKDSAADVAVCSLAVGYLSSIRDLFRELARVSKR